MNAKKTPIEQVNEDHGGKAKLVDDVLGMIDIGDEDKDAARTRLLKASNKKLLRLRANSIAIKDEFSTVDKMVYAVAEKIGRAKDSDFVKRLKGFSPAKLLDQVRSLHGKPRRPVKAVALRAIKPTDKSAAKVEKPKKKVVAKPAKAPNKKVAAKRASEKKAAAVKKKTVKPKQNKK